jgi:hypothetical protein
MPLYKQYLVQATSGTKRSAAPLYQTENLVRLALIYYQVTTHLADASAKRTARSKIIGGLSLPHELKVLSVNKHPENSARFQSRTRAPEVAADLLNPERLLNS